jgi:hypothetical protein
MRSSLLLASLILVALGGAAHADPTHLTVMYGYQNLDPSLEIAVRPIPALELSFSAGRTTARPDNGLLPLSGDEYTDLDASRQSFTLRVLHPLATHLALQFGGGASHEAGTSEHVVHDGLFETPRSEGVQSFDAWNARADIGMTLEVSHVVGRVYLGVDDHAVHPFVGAELGVGF